MTTLNQAYVLAPFHQLLTSCHTNVLIGLRLAERIDTFPGPTPEELKFINLSFGGYEQGLLESKNSFKRWLLLNGFGGIHKTIRTTLERFFVFKSIESRLATNPTLNLQKHEAELRMEARRFHLPELISTVPSLCGEHLQIESHVESFNNARNCLEHDNGTVTKKRCNNPSKDKLFIQGRRFKMFFKDGEREVLAEFGKPGPANAALMLGAEDFEIEFALDQSIELSLKQFIDVLNTCVFFRADIETKLIKKVPSG